MRLAIDVFLGLLAAGGIGAFVLLYKTVGTPISRQERRITSSRP